MRTCMHSAHIHALAWGVCGGRYTDKFRNFNTASQASTATFKEKAAELTEVTSREYAADTAVRHLKARRGMQKKELELLRELEARNKVIAS